MESIKSLLTKAKATRLVGVWLIAVAASGRGVMLAVWAFSLLLFEPEVVISTGVVTVPGMALVGLLFVYASLSLLALSENARKVGLVYAMGMTTVTLLEMIMMLTAADSGDAPGVSASVWITFLTSLISPVVYVGLVIYAHRLLISALVKRPILNWALLALLIAPFIYQAGMVASDPPTAEKIAGAAEFLREVEKLPLPAPAEIVRLEKGHYTTTNSYWFIKLPMYLLALAYLTRPKVKAAFLPETSESRS